MWPDPVDLDYVYSFDTDAGVPVYTATIANPRYPVIVEVQRALDKDGYKAGPADGEFGPKTEDAIKNYQRDHGLAVTGTIGKPLLESLRIS